jgi:hypothetical protein
MRTILFFVVCCLLVGCGLLKPDLVSQGTYRLETVKLEGCELERFGFATSVTEDNGKLLVEAHSRGGRIDQRVKSEAQVSLVSTKGVVLEERTVPFEVRSARRVSPHLHLSTQFDRLPPPGTLIRIEPRFLSGSVIRQACE